MKSIIVLLSFLILATSCKTVEIKEKEQIRKSIVYKKMQNDSESVNFTSINGSLQISGNRNIPSVFITFNALADLKNKKSILKLSVLSKPLVDLYMSNNDFTIVNHTENNYVKLTESDVDFSEILGFNFNPVELTYFLLGLIPYSENMQLVDFTESNNGYLLNITDTTTNFMIKIDDKLRIVNAKIQNQFFEDLNIDVLSFNTDNNGNQTPQRLRVKPENGAVTMTFIIRNTSFENIIIEDFDNKGNYEQLDSPEKIKINVR